MRAYLREWNKRNRARQNLRRNAQRRKATARRRGIRETKAARVADRKARAVCVVCEVPAAVGRYKCPDCLADNRALLRELKARRKAEGRCWRCGRAAAPFVNCARCRAKLRERTKRMATAGLCACGFPARTGKRRCQPCVEYGKRYKARRKAQGLCARHGVPALPGRKSCPRCVERYRRNNAARAENAGRHRERRSRKSSGRQGGGLPAMVGSAHKRQKPTRSRGFLRVLISGPGDAAEEVGHT